MMKKLIIFMVFINILSVCLAEENNIIQIPGTKVKLNIPSTFYRSTGSNTYMNIMNGCVIQVTEAPGAIKDIILEMYFLKSDSIIEGQEIINLTTLAEDKILLEMKMINRGQTGYAYQIITGDDNSIATISGIYFDYTDIEEIKKLKTIVNNAKWDNTNKIDFSELLYFEIDQSDFVPNYFMGDRFNFKFIGEKLNANDEINIQIGSSFHNATIKRSEYLKWAEGLSITPEFEMDFKIKSMETEEIESKGLNGAKVIYTFTSPNGKTNSGINYFFFQPNTLYFLYAKVFSSNHEYYSQKILKLFNSFQLIY